MNDELIKAIWQAGFRMGREAGERNTFAYETGAKPECIEDPDDAWDDLYKTHFSDGQALCALDMNNPKSWQMFT